jgi:hypothetical protein
MVFVLVWSQRTHPESGAPEVLSECCRADNLPESSSEAEAN